MRKFTACGVKVDQVCGKTLVTLKVAMDDVMVYHTSAIPYKISRSYMTIYI